VSTKHLGVVVHHELPACLFDAYSAAWRGDKVLIVYPDHCERWERGLGDVVSTHLPPLKPSLVGGTWSIVHADEAAS
jgi:hypothetical protein